MGFHVTDKMGGMDDDVSVERMKELLLSLEMDDPEHPDVSLTHEFGWCLSDFPSGLVVWENIEDGEARHMRTVSRDKALALWQILASGDIAAIESEPWQNGYG